MRKLETLALPLVERPGRYCGGERNAALKDFSRCEVRMALAVPDAYEVGMSNLGFLIVYHLVNSLDWALCERVFAPWPDMESLLSAHGIPLFSLESRTPLADFDLLGFSMCYEMGFTNILTILRLAGIPWRASDRDERYPLIIGGGCATANPEPVADFFDLFFLGEGEEGLPELLEGVRKAKSAGADRRSLLKELSRIPGVYIPAFYEPHYAGGVFSGVVAKEGAPAVVSKRYVNDLDVCFAPDAPVMPSIEAVHDRSVVELFRGCTRGCRFCQAGMIYRPMRERGPERVNEIVRNLYLNTGCEEVSLLSFNSTDYTELEKAILALDDFALPRRLSVSLPSTRLDSFTSGVGLKLRCVRPSGLTFAPEAGSQRLRDVINKQITEAEMLSSLENAFNAGWKKVKLYFMIGLPTETTEDVEAIAALVDLMLKTAGKTKGRSGKTDFTVSVSNFVPKPHTPFQWAPMDSPESLAEKQRLLRGRIYNRRVKLDTHNVEVSILEGAFARGGRRLSTVIENAWNLGCRFDGWTELFKLDKWKEAFSMAGLDAADISGRTFSPDAPLPWGHLSCGVSEDFLKKEFEKALARETTPWCGQSGPCSNCGIDCRSRKKALL